MNDYAEAAKALVAKYPFLADTGKQPHISDVHSQVYLCFMFVVVFLDEVY